MKVIKSLAFLFVLAILAGHASSAKFIMFSIFGSQGHLNVFYGVAEALVKKGHEVTIVSGHPPKNITGIKEVFVRKIFNIFSNNIEMKTALVLSSIDPTYKEKSKSDWTMLLTVFPAMCSAALDDEEFQNVINEDRHYDVAINDAFLNDCSLPFGSKLAKHVVLLSTVGLFSTTAYESNTPHPLSYIPNMLLPFEAPMTFCERAVNAGFSITFGILEVVLGYSKIDSIIQERYPGRPTVKEVKHNVSLILLNAMIGPNPSIPSLPYVQDIGGIAMTKVKPLSQEFKKFIDDAGPEGFIFVSLGSVVPEEVLPERYKKYFIEAFSKLPQKVIWKFSEQRSDIPRNVLTTKWAPQQDILAHPKCRAFLTHGGGASTTEAMYHGVPTIGMPVFGDQNSNVARAVNKGCSVELAWFNFTAENVLDRINEVLSNPKYKERSQYFSKLMKDQPGPSPQEKAVFWLEYIIRHDGAKHLRTAADHLNFFQYFLLDVIAAATLVLTLVIYVIYKLIRIICCRSKSEQQKGKKKVKKN